MQENLSLIKLNAKADQLSKKKNRSQQVSMLEKVTKIADKKDVHFRLKFVELTMKL